MVRVAAVLSVCLLVWPSSAAAQGKAAALRVFGEFASSVLKSVVTSVAVKEIEGMINGKAIEAAAPPQAPGKQAVAPRATNAKPVAPIPYRITLQWQDPRSASASYVGTLKMQGASGTLRVTMFENGKVHRVVDEQMRAFRTNDVIFLVGSAPKIAGTTIPAANWLSDAFVIKRNKAGVWTITATCDAAGCASVNVIDAAAGVQAQ
jgi:hypothetical protein